jgi:hypothetical protein
VLLAAVASVALLSNVECKERDELRNGQQYRPFGNHLSVASPERDALVS